jgi:hypothetical protein
LRVEKNDAIFSWLLACPLSLRAISHPAGGHQNIVLWTWCIALRQQHGFHSF